MNQKKLVRRVAAIFSVALLGVLLGAAATFYLLLGVNPPTLQSPPATGTSEKSHESVALSQVPQSLINAILAAEDNLFYEHSGVDLVAVIRAFRANIAAGHYVQGASTITMQVARNVVLKDHQKSLRRKLRELFVALQIEREYTKNQILEAYLNHIYFGASAVGIQEATRTYFSKDVEDLSLEEAALLAGLPKAPSEYSPFTNPNKAKARRDVVLQSMRKLNFIGSDIKLKELTEKPLQVTPNASHSHSDEHWS